MPETFDLLNEPIQRVLTHFAGQPAIQAEFVEGLENYVHFMAQDSPGSRDDYLRFIRSWAIRVVQEIDEDICNDIAHTLRLAGAGDLPAPVATEEMLASLG